MAFIKVKFDHCSSPWLLEILGLKFDGNLRIFMRTTLLMSIFYAGYSLPLTV